MLTYKQDNLEYHKQFRIENKIISLNLLHTTNFLRILHNINV